MKSIPGGSRLGFLPRTVLVITTHPQRPATAVQICQQPLTDDYTQRRGCAVPYFRTVMFRMNGKPRAQDAHDCRDAGGRATQEQLPRSGSSQVSMAFMDVATRAYTDVFIASPEVRYCIALAPTLKSTQCPFVVSTKQSITGSLLEHRELRSSGTLVNLTPLCGECIPGPDAEGQVINTTFERALDRSGRTLVENVQHPRVIMQYVGGEFDDTALACDFQQLMKH